MRCRTPQHKALLMSWLITGFEPFGTHTYNPSAHVAEHLGARLIESGARCMWEVIPVTFDLARTYAIDRAPDAQTTLIHVGLAADRAHISLEQRAQNHHGATLDNLGQRASTQVKLDEGGPAQRVTGIDLEALKLAIEHADEAGILPNVHITQDAGSYVCNAIYYHSLRRTPRSLFIHVPDWDAKQATCFAHILANALLNQSRSAG